MGKNKNKVRVTSEASTGLKEYRFYVELYVFKDGGYYVAYCPSLDITDTGNTYHEAVANFYTKFQIYIDWCLEHGTLFDDLKKHGWKKQKNELQPPTFRQQMKAPQLSELMNSTASFERITTPMHIATTV